MKKIALIGGMLILSSCGGGGGGSSELTRSYPLAELSPQNQEVKTSTEVSKAVNSVTSLSESSVKGTTKKESLIKKVLKTIFVKKTRVSGDYGVVVTSFTCDNGYSASIPVNINYYPTPGVGACNNVKSMTFDLDSNYFTNKCIIGNLLLDKYTPFEMEIEAYDFQSDCLPRKVKVNTEGKVFIIDNSEIQETYTFHDFRTTYTNINWSGTDISRADFSIEGNFTYSTDSSEILYSTDVTGTTSTSGDSYSGWIKLGCIDGWFKIATPDPIKYSTSDIPYDGTVVITAKNGKVVISYSPSGIDITETADNQTNTYHYNSFDEIKETVNGTVCVGE